MAFQLPRSRGVAAAPSRAALPSRAGFLCALALALSSVAWVSPAFSQTASEKAAAEALFDEGVDLLKAKKFEEACKKLESSQRIDPGIGTLLYLGECYKQVGRTASAWATFREAASKAEAAGEDSRARAGMQRADDLEPTLSKVTFVVAPENEQIEGLEIQQAGLAVSRPLWGSPVPVDPGEIVVMAMAPGYESFELKMVVKKGPGTVEVKIPPLVPKPEGAVDEAEAPPAKEEPGPVEDSGPPPGQKQRTAGLILGGVGIVGLGVGGVFGIVAMTKEGKASDFCDGATCQPGTEGVSLTNDARSAATVSTIAFAAGGALLATGLVLYFTAPGGKESTALALTPKKGGATLSLRGAF